MVNPEDPLIRTLHSDRDLITINALCSPVIAQYCPKTSDESRMLV
jgi:hypothetical protein